MTFVADWTNRAGHPIGRAEFDTEGEAERHAAWKRATDGGKAVVWERCGVEGGAARRCCPGGWAAGHAYWCVERPAVNPENTPTLRDYEQDAAR